MYFKKKGLKKTRESCDFIKLNKHIVRLADSIMFIFIPASIIFTSATVRFTLAENTSSSVCTVSLLGNFMAVRKFTQMTKINKTLQKSSSIYDVQINNIKINVRENEHRLWRIKKKRKRAL